MSAVANDTYDEATLTRLIQNYQILAARLQATLDRTQGEELRDQLRAQIEELWPYLQQVVKPLTWSWASRYATEFEGSRGRADVLDSLSTTMCMHLLSELTTQTIDQQLRPSAFLRRIAKHRMIDEHRYEQRHAPSRPAIALGLATNISAQATTPLPIDEHTLQLYGEELSQESTSHVDDTIYRQQCWEAIHAYWAYRLKPQELVIVRERMRDPATSHDEIGAMLTPAWTSAAVRKRFQRIVADTRAHLRELGLLFEDLELDA